MKKDRSEIFNQIFALTTEGKPIGEQISALRDYDALYSKLTDPTEQEMAGDLWESLIIDVDPDAQEYQDYINAKD